MQTNRSKSARCVSIVIDYYSTRCFVCSIHKFKCTLCLWHAMRILEFVLPFFSSPPNVFRHFPFRWHVPKNSHIFNSKRLLFICYFVVIYCDFVIAFGCSFSISLFFLLFLFVYCHFANLAQLWASKNLCVPVKFILFLDTVSGDSYMCSFFHYFARSRTLYLECAIGNITMCNIVNVMPSAILNVNNEFAPYNGPNCGRVAKIPSQSPSQ